VLPGSVGLIERVSAKRLTLIRESLGYELCWPSPD
jgi:hypothetical protein